MAITDLWYFVILARLWEVKNRDRSYISGVFSNMSTADAEKKSVDEVSSEKPE